MWVERCSAIRGRGAAKTERVAKAVAKTERVAKAGTEGRRDRAGLERRGERMVDRKRDWRDIVCRVCECVCACVRVCVCVCVYVCMCVCVYV